MNLPQRVHLTPIMRLPRRWSVRVEWEPRDLWIGVFVKRERRPTVGPGLHVYLCPLPTVVLHFVWVGVRPSLGDPSPVPASRPSGEGAER